MKVSREGARYNSIGTDLPTDWLVFAGVATVALARVLIAYFKSRPDKVFKITRSADGTEEILDKNLTPEELATKLSTWREIAELPPPPEEIPEKEMGFHVHMPKPTEDRKPN